MTENVPILTRTVPRKRLGNAGLRSYAAIGVLLLFGLFIAVFIAAMRLGAPAYVPLDVVVTALAVAFLFLVVGQLFVLFTLQDALRTVRRQAIDLAYEEARTSVQQMERSYHASANLLVRTDDRPVEDLEGIGPVFSKRLEEAGIVTTERLRQTSEVELIRIADAMRGQVRKWKAMADLLQVKDVNPQAAELLVVSGVTDVATLAAQDAKTLHNRLKTLNRGPRHVYPERLTRSRIESWVQGAREIRPAVATQRVTTNATVGRTA